MHAICVVVPCYNEADRLPAGEFLSFIDRNPHVSLCFVNDGSVDATSEVLARLREGRDDRVQFVDLPANLGKAEAVRAGFLYAMAWRDFDFIGYLDADLATPLEELNHFLNYVPQPTSFALICGSRVKRMGAQIERKAVRHVLGRIFATFASVVLRLPVYDTQCGAKLIRKDVSARIFDRPFVTRWLFDVEILARTLLLIGRGRAETEILEVPLRAWKEQGKSRLRPGDFLKAPIELVRIHRIYRVR